MSPLVVCAPLGMIIGDYGFLSDAEKKNFLKKLLQKGTGTPGT